MTLHAPSKASFVTSLIIAVIAGLSALSPVPYITPYAIWVAILAYIVLAISSVLSVKFFEKSHPVAALLSTIALFTAGFLVRPLGAFVFGWLGDVVGRKYTFIMTR
jgi:MFS family permease